MKNTEVQLFGNFSQTFSVSGPSAAEKAFGSDIMLTIHYENLVKKYGLRSDLFLSAGLLPSDRPGNAITI